VVLPASVVSLLQVLPPSVDTCHCTVGAGLPEAAAVNVAVWPTGAVALAGCVVTAGAESTLSVFTQDVTVPAALLNTARYSLPLSLAGTSVSVRVLAVAPEMLVNDVPPFVDTCHCTVGAGLPVADAVKVTLPPAVTVCAPQVDVDTGTVSTVSVAAVDVAVPTELVNTARYSLPDSDAVVLATVSVPVALPASLVSLLQVLPPLVDTCHCTVAVGSPEAAAVNVAAWPAVTVALAGWLVIAGAKSTVNVAALVVAVPCELVNTARYS
jgi:hypothetical protein